MAVAILLLVEDEKLQLDSPVSDFLKDYPDKDQGILIRHLLTHTSGIKDAVKHSDWDDLVSM